MIITTIAPAWQADYRSAPARTLRRAANGHAVHAQGRLADADRHALAFLAAHADARIELHVVAYHRDAVQHFRTVADQRGALDRVGHFTVSIIYASLAENTNLPFVMSTWPPPKLTAYRPFLTEARISSGSLSPASM